ncbi:MAG: hypothetical protein R3A52_31405 [Polyangiales bacterium]
MRSWPRLSLRSVTAALSITVLAAGCFSETNLAPYEDAEVPAKDTPVVDAPATDAPPVDAPLTDGGIDAPRMDAPDASEAAVDAPDASDVDAGCTRDEQCTAAGMTRCDTASGRCVACVPSDDSCPAAQHCDPVTFECAPGCHLDEGCSGSDAGVPDGGGADGGESRIGRCDTTRHICIECEVDDTCPVRTICLMGQCVPGCNERRGCGPSEVCCSNVCVNVDTDVANCGACARRCAAANARTSCFTGSCTIDGCDTGFASCNGSDEDGCESHLATDPMNCGMCGRACPTPTNAGSVACADGLCGYTCAEGFADCNGDSRDGCEQRTADNVANCGRCGNACPVRANAAVATCAMGRCGFTCDTGFGDCDGDATTGCETDVRTAVTHCGACGNACPAHATTHLRGGGVRFTCDAGYADCDGDASNGCEVDLNTDVSNCRTCRNACTASGGTPSCVAGACGIASCGASFADCDGNAANGCETDLRTTASHCGRCGSVCPTPSHATGVCAGGSCAFVCDAGFDDCDGNAANGCEVSTATSTTHCGVCGRACTAPFGTAGCTAGSCTVATCDAGRGNCDGNATNGCETNLATSPNHCGACGVRGVEVCDGVDNSCNGVVDEGCPTGLTGTNLLEFAYRVFGSGEATQNQQCPAGAFARGIFGRYGGLVSQLGMLCGTPRLVTDTSTRPYRYSIAIDPVGDSGAVQANAPTGTGFSFECPANSVVGRVFGRGSPYLYQVGVECVQWTVTGTPATGFRLTHTTTTTSTGYGTASGSTFDYRCPADTGGTVGALRGLSARPFALISSYIDWFGVNCTSPDVTVR